MGHRWVEGSGLSLGLFDGLSMGCYWKAGLFVWWVIDGLALMGYHIGSTAGIGGHWKLRTGTELSMGWYYWKADLVVDLYHVLQLTLVEVRCPSWSSISGMNFPPSCKYIEPHCICYHVYGLGYPEYKVSYICLHHNQFARSCVARFGTSKLEMEMPHTQ